MSETTAEETLTGGESTDEATDGAGADEDETTA